MFYDHLNHHPYDVGPNRPSIDFDHSPLSLSCHRWPSHGLSIISSQYFQQIAMSTTCLICLAITTRVLIFNPPISFWIACNYIKIKMRPEHLTPPPPTYHNDAPNRPGSQVQNVQNERAKFLSGSGWFWTVQQRNLLSLTNSSVRQRWCGLGSQCRAVEKRDLQLKFRNKWTWRKSDEQKEVQVIFVKDRKSSYVLKTKDQVI